MFVFFVAWIIDRKVTFLLWDFAPRQMGPVTRIVYSVKQRFVNRRETRGFGITAFPESWGLLWIRQFRFFENILSACKTMNKQKSRMLHRTILSIISICSFKFAFVILFFPVNKAYSGCALFISDFPSSWDQESVFHRHQSWFSFVHWLTPPLLCRRT